MSKAAWLNLLLAGIVAALGVLVTLKPDSSGPHEYSLATLNPGGARSIQIERPGAKPIVLEKRDNAWVMSAPLAARADPERIQRLLAIAGAQSSNRIAATDLARFELERPTARITIDGQSFDFGMVSPVTREQYVLTGEAVYTVGLQYAAALPGEPADVIDKQLLSAAETPVRFEFAAFAVAKDKTGKWTLRPSHGELSQDDFQAWQDGWRNASALRVEPYTSGKPLGTIKVGLATGTELVLTILAREPQLALLRTDENLVYYFLKEPAQRLISPPAAKP